MCTNSQLNTDELELLFNIPPYDYQPYSPMKDGSLLNLSDIPGAKKLVVPSILPIPKKRKCKQTIKPAKKRRKKKPVVDSGYCSDAYLSSAGCVSPTVSVDSAIDLSHEVLFETAKESLKITEPYNIESQCENNIVQIPCRKVEYNDLTSIDKENNLLVSSILFNLNSDDKDVENKQNSSNLQLCDELSNLLTISKMNCSKPNHSYCVKDTLNTSVNDCDQYKLSIDADSLDIDFIISERNKCSESQMSTTNTNNTEIKNDSTNFSCNQNDDLHVGSILLKMNNFDQSQTKGHRKADVENTNLTELSVSNILSIGNTAKKYSLSQILENSFNRDKTKSEEKCFIIDLLASFTGSSPDCNLQSIRIKATENGDEDTKSAIVKGDLRRPFVLPEDFLQRYSPSTNTFSS